jgi:hypothetical protein
MPLTSFQKEVLYLLAARRSPESHVGGGAALNRSDASPRFSADRDIFHDIAASVLASAEADAAALLAAGFVVEWLLRQPYLQRARVSRAADDLRLDWCYDSAFRFFPVQSDPEFGYCLHPADLATNKALALAGRSEVRDFLDILYLHEHYLSLGAICWAACGKDQGFTPWSLLEHARRNTKYRQADVESEHLAWPVRLTELKEAWLRAADEVEAWFEKLPPADAGCLYLDAAGMPFTPDPATPGFVGVTRHFGSVRGTWPRLA